MAVGNDTVSTGIFLDLISIVLIVIPVAIAILRGMGLDEKRFLAKVANRVLTFPMTPAIFSLRECGPPET